LRQKQTSGVRLGATSASEAVQRGSRHDYPDGQVCYFSHVNCFVDGFCLRRKGNIANSGKEVARLGCPG
jgi:hypothetical protein